MIYLYFAKEEHTLYMFTEHYHMGGDLRNVVSWTEIEAVAADQERGQILAYGKIGTGIVAEFPIQRTVLTCQKPHLI